MQLVTCPQEMRTLSRSWRFGQQTIGFVPTMGALHHGHLELCRSARRDHPCFVASIFVNPTQFGRNEDLAKYPRPLEKDMDLLKQMGCDVLFLPTAETMYGNSERRNATWVDVSPLDEMWEGVTRPGHMRGVATVVSKLLNIVEPDAAYFGEKDYQQLRTIETLVQDLNFAVEIVPVPTLREPDGLAYSSRNVYLAPEERQAAPVLAEALRATAELAASGEKDVLTLGKCMEAVIGQEPVVKVQYVGIVDADTLEPLQQLDGRPARIIVAAFLGQTRLIDNWPL